MPTPRLRLVLDVPDASVQAAIEACEAEIFTAWFGNTAEDLARAYGPYPRTHWLAVLDEEDRVFGVSRLFLPSAVRSKTLDDVAAEPWNADPQQVIQQAGIDPASTLDLATCAARLGLSRAGFSVSHALLYGWFAMARANACRTMTFVLDATPDRLLRQLGLHFRTLPGTGPAPYFGSPSSRPVYGHVDQMIAEQRRLNPDAHRAIILGSGLSGVSVPPIGDFAVAEPEPRLCGA